jgi:hypothetical protein
MVIGEVVKGRKKGHSTLFQTYTLPLVLPGLEGLPKRNSMEVVFFTDLTDWQQTSCAQFSNGSLAISRRRFETEVRFGPIES